MISVVVLAFNEEKHLAQTVSTIIDAARLANNIPLDVIIIDDGSTDKTPAIIKDLKNTYSFVRSIDHAQNQGPGVGVKQAIKIAHYPKFIVTPGDNDLPRDLLENLFNHHDKADLVLAFYRNMHERGFFRCGLSQLYTAIYRFTFNIPIHYINSPCLYPTEHLRCIYITSDRFGYSAEMTVKLLRKGLTFHQVGGLRRIDAHASRAISWKNLKEIVSVYGGLFWDVKLRNRREFNHHPLEIH